MHIVFPFKQRLNETLTFTTNSTNNFQMQESLHLQQNINRRGQNKAC